MYWAEIELITFGFVCIVLEIFNVFSILYLVVPQHYSHWVRGSVSWQAHVAITSATWCPLKFFDLNFL